MFYFGLVCFGGILLVFYIVVSLLICCLDVLFGCLIVLILFGCFFIWYCLVECCCLL